MAKTSIIIIGAGGFGREVAAMLGHDQLNKHFEVMGFVDDQHQPGEVINGLPVLGSVNWLLNFGKRVSVVIAIGDPQTRSGLFRILSSNPLFEFPNIIHPEVRIHDPERVVLGKGNIICDGVILTTNINIGNYNIINLSCTIGHDVEISNLCSIMPAVNISGGAKLNDRVYLGTGAKLIKSTTLGASCVVGAGAVVNTDIPANITVVGVPAKPIDNH